eukprot:COSAG02_NODE_4747_length_5030_cov_83.260799_6_plen_89_part_00
MGVSVEIPFGIGLNIALISTGNSIRGRSQLRDGGTAPMSGPREKCTDLAFFPFFKKNVAMHELISNGRERPSAREAGGRACYDVRMSR